MLIDARVALYDVKRCGYYAGRRTSPDFAGLADTLASLRAWVSGTTPLVIRDTQTFEPDDGETEQMPVFCYSITESAPAGEYLLVTWNQTELANDAFGAISADGAVGAATIQRNNVGANMIPGFPSYFWFLPQQNLVVTVVLSGRSNGHRGMNQYMRGYLERRAGWVANGESGTDVVGYREGTDDPDSELAPSFSSYLIKNAGPIDEIRQNRTSIRRVVRRDTFYPNGEHPEVRTTLLQRLLWWEAEQPPVAPERMEFALQYTPTSEQLERLIAQWEATEGSSVQWDDVGFDLRGGKTLWLSKSRARGQLQLELQEKNGTGGIVYDETVLLSQLAAHRNDVLALFQRARERRRPSRRAAAPIPPTGE